MLPTQTRQRQHATVLTRQTTSFHPRTHHLKRHPPSDCYFDVTEAACCRRGFDRGFFLSTGGGALAPTEAAARRRFSRQSRGADALTMPAAINAAAGLRSRRRPSTTAAKNVFNSHRLQPRLRRRRRDGPAFKLTPNL